MLFYTFFLKKQHFVRSTPYRRVFMKLITKPFPVKNGFAHIIGFCVKMECKKGKKTKNEIFFKKIWGKVGESGGKCLSLHTIIKTT